METYLQQVEEVKSLHRAWMAAHPNYDDHDTKTRKICHDPDYINLLYSATIHNINFHMENKTVDEFRTYLKSLYLEYYMKDQMKITKEHKELEQMQKLLLGTFSDKPNKWFFTIGFNHQTFNIPAAVSVIRSICNNKIFKNIRGVFEMFRENGEHPHVHFLAELNEPLPKSKLVEKIWATKGIKKIVLKKTFVDIKKAEDYHENYILGIKKKEKLEFIQKDKEFRKKNNIPEFFSQPIL